MPEIYERQPFFSILIPSYNRPEDIAKTINSLQKGHFKDFEIIISDDCSPQQEEISAVVKPYLKHKHISFFQQRSNLREPDNKNFLIDAARGKYNIVIGDDDQFCEDALDILKKYIDENPHYEFFGFGYNVVDEHERLITSYKTNKIIEICARTPVVLKEIFNARTLPLWLFHPATFCCKAGIEVSLRYQNDVGMAEDMWFMFDLLAHDYKMLIIPEYIFNWRKVQEANSSLQINQSLELLANFNARYLMFKKMTLNTDALPATLRSYLLSGTYRQIFIYNSLLAEQRFTVDRYDELDVDKLHLTEIIDYTKTWNFFYSRGKIRISSLFAFLRVAGYFNGSISIVRMALHKLSYKFHL
jgi:glycosyltransferase involved in cell wall biosynthesis